MRRKLRPSKLLLSGALLSIAALAAAPRGAASADPAARQNGEAARQVLIFAVANETGDRPTIEPIAAVSGKKFATPAAGGEGDDELKKFADAYYRAGQKYRVLSGGGEAGGLTVKRARVEDECFRGGADVEVQSPVKVGRVLLALATNSETLGAGRAPARRAPTDAERAAALRLAGDVMRQKRVPAAALATLESINLTATDLDGDGRFELVGSFRAKQGARTRHLLFLVAEPQGDSFKAGLANYEAVAARDMPDPGLIDEVGNAGFLAEILVDQADFDGDRVGEVVSTASSFEGQSYHIYKREGGRWQKAYEVANYRCAY